MRNRACVRTPGIAAGVILVCCLQLSAGLIDVSGAATVVLQAGQQLQFDVNLANFASNNPGAPVASQLNLEVLAPANQGPVATLPGSTVQYDRGNLLQAQIINAAGQTLAWLYDPAATRAGFGQALLLREGWLAVGSNAQPIGVIGGGAGGSFGPAVVCILLTNLGSDISLGAGDGFTLRSSFLLEAAGAGGTRQTTGVVERILLDTGSGAGGALPTPEPNSALLVLLAALPLVFRYYRNSRA